MTNSTELRFVLAERQQCIADICSLCAIGDDPEKDMNGVWFHMKPTVTFCKASNIHNRTENASAPLVIMDTEDCHLYQLYNSRVIVMAQRDFINWSWRVYLTKFYDDHIAGFAVYVPAYETSGGFPDVIKTTVEWVESQGGFDALAHPLEDGGAVRIYRRGANV